MKTQWNRNSVLRFPTEKGTFSTAVSTADMKENILKGYANISVILSLFEIMNIPRCVKCSTLWCHFALMKGKQEFVWFRNLTTLILPRFVDFPWIILGFSSHTFIVSLKSWSRCACFMSSQSAIYVKKILFFFFDMQDTFMNDVKMRNLGVILKPLLRCQWKCTLDGCNEREPDMNKRAMCRVTILEGLNEGYEP